MEITMLQGKIHRATVNRYTYSYVGSVTVDRDLLDAAGILEYQQVQVVNINTGARLETYTIAGEPGSGILCLNGAAARCANAGDKVILMAYARMDPQEAQQHRPKVVFVDGENRISQVFSYEKHGECRRKRHSKENAGVCE